MKIAIRILLGLFILSCILSLVLYCIGSYYQGFKSKLDDPGADIGKIIEYKMLGVKIDQIGGVIFKIGLALLFGLLILLLINYMLKKNSV